MEDSMKNKILTLALTLFAAGAVVTAQSARSAEVLFKAAQNTEEVQGDLKGAIDAYKKAVAAAGANRSLAAQALVRMAQCYQKLGDAEAQRVYERVVRDYAEQRDAVAVARSRLGGKPLTNSRRHHPPKVWDGQTWGLPAAGADDRLGGRPSFVVHAARNRYRQPARL